MSGSDNNKHLTLEDFEFVGAKSRRLISRSLKADNVNTIDKIRPFFLSPNVTGCFEFGFSLRINRVISENSRTSLLAGIRRKEDFEKIWCFSSMSRDMVHFREKTPEMNEFRYIESLRGVPPLADGDELSFHCNEIEKRFYVRIREGTHQHIFEDVNTEDLSFFTVFDKDETRLDLEVVKYWEIRKFIVDKTSFDEDLETRKGFLNDNHDLFSSFTVHTKHKNIQLFKPYLIFSRIDSSQLETENSTNILKDYDLDIEEEIVLDIISGAEGVKLKNQVDYYLFFREMGLKREMMYVVEQVNFESFEKTFFEFKRIAEKYENETVKSWFTNSMTRVNVVDETTFSTSLCLQLFNCLKDNEDDLNPGNNDELFSILNINNIIFHLRKYKNRVNFQQHMDYEGVRMSRITSKKLFGRLRNGMLSNITVVSSDGKGFLVHREVLVLRTNFFHRMFSFGGKEMTELVETGKIRMETLSSEVLSALIDYVYTGEVKEEKLKSIEVILHLSTHAHMFHEQELFRYCLNVVYNSSVMNVNDFEDMLLESGHLLYGNDTLCRYLVPRLVKVSNRKFSEEKIRKIVRKSHYHQKNRIRFENIEKEVEVLKEENMSQRNEIDELTKTVEDLQSRVDDPLFGGGVIRKRGNDEDGVDEEKPKKKRKLE